MPRYFNCPSKETDWPDWPTKKRREYHPSRWNFFPENGSNPEQLSMKKHKGDKGKKKC